MDSQIVLVQCEGGCGHQYADVTLTFNECNKRRECVNCYTHWKLQEQINANIQMGMVQSKVEVGPYFEYCLHDTGCQCCACGFSDA